MFAIATYGARAARRRGGPVSSTVQNSGLKTAPFFRYCERGRPTGQIRDSQIEVRAKEATLKLHL